MNGGVPRRELVGWKNIAGYLNVDIRTAQRWGEQLNLPVRRTPSGRVFADPDELDKWRAGAGSQPQAEAPQQTPDPPPFHEPLRPPDAPATPKALPAIEQPIPQGWKRHRWHLVLAVTVQYGVPITIVK